MPLDNDVDHRCRNNGEDASRLAAFRRRLEAARRDISESLAELDEDADDIAAADAARAEGRYRPFDELLAELQIDTMPE